MFFLIFRFISKEIVKTITLGRLETSEDFRAESPKVPQVETISALKIEVRPTTKEDIIQRQLPQNVSGLVITKIEADSPINYLKVNDIIVEEIVLNKKTGKIYQTGKDARLRKRSSS